MPTEISTKPLINAIIQSGGKQYHVSPGQYLRVAKINKNPGSRFEITEVLAIGGDNPLFGEPFVPNAKVEVTVRGHGKDKKILVFKKQRRKRHRRLKGHRQAFTELQINQIITP